MAASRTGYRSGRRACRPSSTPGQHERGQDARSTPGQHASGQKTGSTLWGGAAIALLALMSGCQAPQPNQANPANPPGPIFGKNEDQKKDRSETEIDPLKVEERDDIVAIRHFWPQDPWLRESGEPVGFRVPVYFVSGQTEKGAFVPGTIIIWMYEVGREPGGKFSRSSLHIWEFKHDQATGFRVRRKAVGGYYYGFALTWPPELAVPGKLVEIEFGYERVDKSVITGPARRFRVPLSADAPRPAPRYSPTTQRSR